MKILAVGAHPDDVEFGCAPILIQEVRNGHEARILVTSKGEAASAGKPEERAQEARDAARIIGAAIQFLELGGDCHIEHNTANAMTLAREIRRVKPDVILAPHLGENQHPDHAAVGKSSGTPPGWLDLEVCGILRTFRRIQLRACTSTPSPRYSSIRRN